ncbi:SEC-C metal-binding domain-containing protein [Aliiglaciecola aliphaticivorans]
MNEEESKQSNSFSESKSSCCSNTSCCAPQTPVKRDLPKVGRNDACPCDSGRKFKKCCGQ